MLRREQFASLQEGTMSELEHSKALNANSSQFSFTKQKNCNKSNVFCIHTISYLGQNQAHNSESHGRENTVQMFLDKLDAEDRSWQWLCG